MIVWIIKIIDWNRFANQLRGAARNYFGDSSQDLTTLVNALDEV